MALKPSFTWTSRLMVAQVSVANANRDGTGDVQLLGAGVAASTNGPGGTKVFRITAKATGTTTAGVVRIYVSTDNGATKRLFHEFAVSAISAAADTPTWSGSATFDDFVLPDANAKLYASTERAEAFNIFVDGGDLTG